MLHGNVRDAKIQNYKKIKDLKMSIPVSQIEDLKRQRKAEC
jgi:hypothetical protein